MPSANTIRNRRREYSDRLLASLKRAVDIDEGAVDFFFLAMASHKAERTDAREWFDKAAAWTKENKPDDKELKRFRAEAAKLLGVEIETK